MTDMDAAYYAENPDQFESLSEAEQDAIISGGMLGGSDDTGEEVSEDDLDLVLEGDVDISAKDGKHKIPYDELKSARQSAYEEKSRADQLQALADQQAQLIADLQEAKNQDALTGGTDAQDAVIDDFREEFSDMLGENFEKYLSQVIDEKVKPFREKADLAESKLKSIEDERQQEVNKQAKDAWDKRVEAFESVYPNWEETNQSKEFIEWFEKLPEFQQQAAQTFNPENHKFIFDAYAKEKGITVKQEQAIAEPPVKSVKVPTLLNDVSGKSGEISPAERYMSMSKDQQAAFLAKMDDPAAIEKLVADIKMLQS